MKNIIILIIMLITLPLSSQVYLGINGGKEKNTLGIGANLRYDIYDNIGFKVNYMNSEYYEKEIFSVQSNYILNKNSFYTPMVSAGVEFNNTTNPLLSFNNLFKIEYFHILLGIDSNLISSYYNIGIIVQLVSIKNKHFKPRFF